MVVTLCRNVLAPCLWPLEQLEGQCRSHHPDFTLKLSEALGHYPKKVLLESFHKVFQLEPSPETCVLKRGLFHAAFAVELLAYIVSFDWRD
jgi:hypothetical protein